MAMRPLMEIFEATTLSEETILLHGLWIHNDGTNDVTLYGVSSPTPEGTKLFHLVVDAATEQYKQITFSPALTCENGLHIYIKTAGVGGTGSVIAYVE